MPSLGPVRSQAKRAARGPRSGSVALTAESETEEATAAEASTERIPLPRSIEEMCTQAADACMKAYRDGYPRQSIRLGVDQIVAGDDVLPTTFLKKSLPVLTDFTQKLWDNDDLQGVKTSIIDGEVGTLLYREATAALQDAAVLFLMGRDSVLEPKVASFEKNMGDRLIVLANTESAPAPWSPLSEGTDFFLTNDMDEGALVAKKFKLTSYYLYEAPLNNWRTTTFRAYPGKWQIWIESLDLKPVFLGEFDEKPFGGDIIELQEKYEGENDIPPYKKIGKMLKDVRRYGTDEGDQES